jgi:hypothetical protein
LPSLKYLKTKGALILANMDKDAEPIGNDTSNTNGALFYVVRTTRGSLIYT